MTIARTPLRGVPMQMPRSAIEPRGREGRRLSGHELATVASSLERVQRAHVRYQTLKAESQDLLTHFVDQYDPTTVRELVGRIMDMRGERGDSALVRLSAGQFSILLRASLSMVSTNLGLASAILSGPSAVLNEARALKLVRTAETLTSVTDNVIYSINVSRDVAGRAARATGLSEPATISGAVLFGAILAGTILTIVAMGLLYTWISSISQAQVAQQEATAACERDAAAGRPCTGSDWAAYRAAAAEEQRRSGVVPNIDDLLRRGSNALITAGFGILAVAIGYGLWVSAPAAMSARRRLQDHAESYRR